MKNVVILVAIIGICLIAGTIPVGNAASDNYNVRVRWLEFVHEKAAMDDYYFAVEFRIPSVEHYDAERIGPCRYLSEVPDVYFPVEESWIGQRAEITISAVWHAHEFIIDINPNLGDGRWTAFGKQASALVIEYNIGEAKVVSADGNDDGYLSDLRNDAYIRLMIETLIPRFNLTIERSEGGETFPLQDSAYAYAQEDVITIRAIPYSEYSFSHWILDGHVIKTENPEITVAMNSQHTLRAVFAKEGTQFWIVFAVTAVALTAGLLGILGYRRYRFKKRIKEG